jgi:hypothetical protein
VIENRIIYQEPGRFAGWPANYGIWAWGDEIVVGFTVGYHQYHDEHIHARDKHRPFTTMQARSLDGGQTWDVQPMPCRTPGQRALSADEHVIPELAIGPHLASGLENAPTANTTPINFAHPAFALMCARTGLAAGAVSWFYIAYDRCHTWQGPFGLSDFGLPGIAARTDYLVDGPDTCTLFLTAAKTDGHEGRVFCARTTDAGLSFEFLSWIGPEPDGFAIMPASLRLTDQHLLCAIRCRGAEGAWIDLYESHDNGATWDYRNRPAPAIGSAGNPPAFIQLQDGRLCLIYGYRAAPYGLRARLSTDEGQTWSDEIVLRADAGNRDIGYPRAVQRLDGTVVTVYYYNDAPTTERYIAATLWKP